MNYYTDTWASVANWTHNLIDQINALNPDMTFSFIDWEAHGDTPELPDGHLIGPLALALREYDDGLIEFTLSVGVSTYTNDAGLTRLREAVNEVFKAMMSGQKIRYYNHRSYIEESVFQFIPGTEIAPMTRMQVRPFQFVQASGVLVPIAEA